MDSYQYSSPSGGGGGGGGVYGMFGPQASQLLAQQQQSSAQPSTTTDYDWSTQPAPISNELDLVFIMDATGSMGSYIDSATKNIETICENIVQSERLSTPGALRVGLVAFRDHPPQDYSYITKDFGFTSSIASMKENLAGLYASGGGDGPEAITAALKCAVEMDWRPSATRLAVLITDAPPHGIGEYGDGFPKGSPEGSDPLVLARRMAQLGISLFMVACEPGLSSYSNGPDFYQGIVRITSGLLVPLTTASLLTHVIIAAAGEAMALNRLHTEVGDAVVERLKSLSLEAVSSGEGERAPADLMDQVANDLHQRLLLRNESTKQLVVESIYRESNEARQNIEVWSTAPDIETAKPHIQKVYGSRLSDKWLATRQASTSFTSHAPFPRSRPSKASSSTSTWNNVASSSSSAASSSSFNNNINKSIPSANSPPSSSRKVLSDFSTFSAGAGMSMSGSPSFGSPQRFGGTTTKDVASSTGSPGSNASLPTFYGARTGSAFGGSGSGSSRGNAGMRAGSEEEDEDGEEEDQEDRPLPVAVETDGGTLEFTGEDGTKLRFKQDSISLDQARRLAMSSAYRAGFA